MAQIETSVQIAAPAELVSRFCPTAHAYWYGAEMERAWRCRAALRTLRSPRKCESADI